MSILSKATKQRTSGLVLTFVGAPGTGKTSTAATFPEPFLIRTQGEDVPRDMPSLPDSIGVTESTEALWEQLKALLQDDHEYKTLIIDSITGLEQMFIQDVLSKDPKAKGINQAFGGYGAGPSAVAANHMRVRKAVELLRSKRGMNTVFVAHADIGRIDPPDSEGFSQYTLRLSSKSMAPYTDSVDLVGFLRQDTILRGEEGERKRATGTDKIIMTTYLNPAFVSKNRLGINKDIIVERGVNPLADYL